MRKYNWVLVSNLNESNKVIYYDSSLLFIVINYIIFKMKHHMAKLHIYKDYFDWS